MATRIIRCRKCLYKNNTGSQEPCTQCKEIQYKFDELDNHFVPADKNLMMEVVNEHN